MSILDSMTGKLPGDIMSGIPKYMPTSSGNILMGAPTAVMKSITTKASEIIPKLDIAMGTNGTGILKDFSAISSQAMTAGASKVINNIGQQAAAKLQSVAGFGGASALSSMLGQKAGVNSDAGGKQYFITLASQQEPGEIIIFNVMPAISESREASYSPVEIAHHPGQILKYQSTTTRKWNLDGAKFISRTIAEATSNQKNLNILRSWLMPYYGQGTASKQSGSEDKLGAPPAVLTFTAFGDQNIGPVPVVLTSLGVNWPNDVDYIHTSSNQPFPVILNLSISLEEAWSPKEYSGFDLYEYKAGNMKNAYIPISYSSVSDQVNPEKAPTQANAPGANTSQDPSTKSAVSTTSPPAKAASPQNKPSTAQGPTKEGAAKLATSNPPSVPAKVYDDLPPIARQSTQKDITAGTNRVLDSSGLFAGANPNWMYTK